MPNVLLDIVLQHAFIEKLKLIYPNHIRYTELFSAVVLPTASLLLVQPLEMIRTRLAAD